MAAEARPRHKEAAAKGLAAASQLVDLQDVTRLSTAELVAQVAGGALASPSKGTAAAQPAASVQQLLDRFERCDRELAKLQQQVDLRAERLRREVGAQEAGHAAQLAGLEAQWAGVRQGFGELEGRMTGVTQAATKVGNRLQNAELYRRRALDAIEKINCLQEFAHARDPSSLPPLFHDDSRLAEAAAMTARLLAVAQELLSSRELQRTSGLGEPAAKAGGGAGAPELGTLENAVEQLELYRNVLDNRVVSRFDAALARQDLPAMADCARIMAEFSRGEAILVQRYISTRPMFTNLRELQFAAQQQQQQQQAAAAAAAAATTAGAGSAEAAAAEAEAAADLAALRGLSGLYKGILAAMRDEAVVIEQVFPSPYRAMAQYAQRVFEQKVQAAVDAVLRPVPAGANHTQLRARLRLMAEVYHKTRALAEDLQELCGGEGGGGAASSPAAAAGPGTGSSAAAGLPPVPRVRDMADVVCAEALEPYLGMELRWLAGLYEARAAALGRGSGLSMELLLDLLAANEEAAARCALLSPPALLAANTRQLFHASTRKQANTGCLLEQVATHILLGLGAAMEAATRALLAPFRPQQLLDAQAAAAPAASVPAGSPGAAAGGQQQRQQQQGAAAAAGGGLPAAAGASEGGPGSGRASRQGSLSRAALQRAAALSVASSVGELLQAVSTIGAMVRAVQQHYQRVLAPHLAGSGTEARACGAGLAALVRAIDERVAAALQRCLGLLRSQADMTLVAEQQRGDFCPGEAAPPPSLDEPTPAAATVYALLGAAVDAAEQHLHGPNLAAFLAELGRRTCALLDAHQQRFVFSPLGALRWKRDLAEYAALAARLRSPPARRHLDDMQAHVNMLIVAPGSLLALVDGSLRIPHAAALAVIQLREDFRSARVGEGGATLSAVFSGE